MESKGGFILFISYYLLMLHLYRYANGFSWNSDVCRWKNNETLICDIRTHNITQDDASSPSKSSPEIWIGIRSLEINCRWHNISDFRDFSTHAQQIREIRVKNCHHWKIPKNLEALTILNATANHIADVAPLNTLVSLQMLDLSNNAIEVLPPESLDLKMLNVLNMSNNHLITIPLNSFKWTRRLHRINLHSNRLESLPAGVFGWLEVLDTLDLSHNRLDSLTFLNGGGLQNLRELHLSHNRLTTLTRYFTTLQHLELLDLEGNAIVQVSEDTFNGLGHLRMLILASNKLTQLPARIFHPLHSIQHLYMESNRLTTLPDKLFSDCCRKLIDLNLSENDFTSVPRGIDTLHELKSLDLGGNRIRIINGSQLVGLTQLLGLRLVDNHIENINGDSFRHLHSLRVINLASNAIHYLAEDAFVANTDLRVIRLDNNRISNIPPLLLLPLESLVWLNLSTNHLTTLNFAALPPQLEWLDATINNLDYLENSGSNLHLSLRHINLAGNKLPSMFPEVIPNGVESLHLGNNSIVQLERNVFHGKSHLTHIDLSHNHLHYLDSSIFPPRMIVSLAGNPFPCDCSIQWLLQATTTVNLPFWIDDLQAVTCVYPLVKRSTQRFPLYSLQQKNLICKYREKCDDFCHCCDFEACDCNNYCPERCECFFEVRADGATRSNVVDCGHGNFTEMPDRIPMGATTIYLDGNSVSDVGSFGFIGKKHLEVLYLNRTSIHTIHNATFSGLTQLRHLHLQFNLIESLYGNEFHPLVNLQRLYLHNNRIGSIANATFSHMTHLKELTLAHNGITTMALLQLLSPLISRHILRDVYVGNIFSCDCTTLAKMVTPPPRDMVCHSVEGGTKPITDVCAHLPIFLLPPNRMNYVIGGDYLSIVAATLVSTLSIVVLIIVIFIFRRNLLLILFTKCGIRCHTGDPSSDRDCTKLYDAFVFCSSRDADFVDRFVVAQMEHIGFSVYLAPSQNTLHVALDIATKLIVIVSSTFLQLEWKSTNFRTILTSPNTWHGVILIIAVPLELLTADPDLMKLVKHTTVLFLGEKRFWDKLKYAMPPREGIQKSLTVRNTLTCAPSDSTSTSTSGIAKRSSSHIYTTILADEVTTRQAYFV